MTARIKSGHGAGTAGKIPALLAALAFFFAVFSCPSARVDAAGSVFTNTATVEADIRALLQSTYDSMGAETNFTVQGEEMSKKFFVTDSNGNCQIFTDASGNDAFQTTPLVQLLIEEQIMDMRSSNDNAYTRLALESYAIYCSASYHMEGSIVHVTEINFRYTFTWRDGASALAAKNAVISHANAFLSSATYPSGASEYKRLKAINEYICHTFQYDYRLFVESEASSTIYSAYRMITDTGAIGGYGRGVCQAYAMYASIMLKQAGFEVITIDGTANGGGHVWNMVRLGSAWYHIDFTWDDPISSGNPPPYTLRQTGGGVVSETYLIRTDSEISINHAWSAVQSGYRYPVTPTVRYSEVPPMPDNIPTQYNPVPTATPFPTLLPTKTVTQAAGSAPVSAGSGPSTSQAGQDSSAQTMSGYLSSRTDSDSSSAAPQPILNISDTIPDVIYGIPVVTWLKGIGITIAILALLLLIINKRRKRWQ